MKGNIKGSETRHITLTEFYRNHAIESQNLQTNIEGLLAVEDTKHQSIEEFKQKHKEFQALGIKPRQRSKIDKSRSFKL